MVRRPRSLREQRLGGLLGYAASAVFSIHEVYSGIETIRH